ncbi:MAG: glycosyltransferase [Candidatus Desulfofervidaceae bacterium]|nr:glycosyltransferase [Candidatus Desulfofervidaceae bacterium]
MPVYNKIKYTRQCIETLFRVTPLDLFELIIVNNASTDGTKEFLDELTKQVSNVRIIHNEENLGFAKACNQGAKVAEGKYLVFLNNDTIPLASWLEEMIGAAESDKNVGIVGSKLIFPDGTIQHAGVVVYDFPYPVSPYHIYYRKPTDIPEANIMKEYQAVTGACMLIHKDVFERIGGFDEEFLNGYEDVDLCFRVRELGYKVIYCPNSMLYHFEGQTKGRHNLEKENLERLNQKWVNKIKPDKKVDSLSIIIVTYNSLNDLPSCLKSILLFTSLEHYEIIIIDNNSVDGTKQFLKSFQENQKKASFLIKLIFNEENLGFSKACNQGIKEARGKYIVLLNPDTIVTPDWDKRMIAHFADGVGAVGPVSNYVAGLQNLSVYLQDLPPIMDSTAINQISEKMFKQYRGKSIETKLLIGFCLMTRKEILDKLGMLDENLFLGNDDLELSWRLRLNGYKLVVAPDVFVYHKGQASFKTKPSHETEKLVQESTDKLAEKLIKHYGFGNVPLPEELWGINWFRPSAKYSGMFKQLDKKVSIVILNYKLPEDTLECIQSIYNNIYDKFQIIVVDNGSHDGSVAKIINWAEKNKKRFIYCKEKNFIFPEEKFKQELVIIENKENLGFTGGNNIGIEYALGCGAEYIWFLNNDTVVDKNALSELVRLAELDKEIGVISSKLYFYENPTKVQYDGDKSNLYDGLPDTLYDIPRITSRPSGCSFLMRREVIESVGLWDEDYFLYFDDNDMAERAVKQGWKVFYNPYSKVYHKGAKSTGGWLASPLSVYYVTRNLLLFYYKHRGFKLEEAFSHIKDFSFQFISDPHKLYTLVKGIEDFIYGHRGKAKINFSELSKVWEKERKETIQELIQDKLERAFQKAKRALLIEPNHTNLNEFLKIAQELALQKLEKEKSIPMKYYEQGETLYNNGQVEEAIAAFNKALDLDFSFALAHNNLAFIYWQKKDVDKALYHLSKAMELSPDNRDIIWNCGQIMLGLGYVQHAYDVYKSYLQKHPDEVEIKQVVEELDQKRMMRTGNE